MLNKIRRALKDRRGGMYVDQAMLIVIAVVVGILLLTGLYYLFRDSILPGLANKITEIFS